VFFCLRHWASKRWLIRHVTCGTTLESASKVAGAFAVKIDVSLKGGVDLMVEKVLRDFFTIDILVNNAGVCYKRLFEEISE